MIKNYNNISGLLLIDKPSGVTSFKITHKIRKILNVKKTGHCGTLDPSATGLLLVLVGEATRLQGSFMKKDKIYTSSFLMGITTDTGDLDGNIISKSSILDIDFEKIVAAVETFRGEILQIPPMYSALKHNGKKLYEFARQGIEVERKPRKVTIKQFNILSYKHDILNVKVFCSSGTYIRTLARDLGNLLGCGATVKTLRRDVIGVFDVKNALSFDDLRSPGKIMEKLIPYEKLLELVK